MSQWPTWREPLTWKSISLDLREIESNKAILNWFQGRPTLLSTSIRNHSINTRSSIKSGGLFVPLNGFHVATNRIEPDGKLIEFYNGDFISKWFLYVSRWENVCLLATFRPSGSYQTRKTRLYSNLSNLHPYFDTSSWFRGPRLGGGYLRYKYPENSNKQYFTSNVKVKTRAQNVENSSVTLCLFGVGCCNSV